MYENDLAKQYVLLQFKGEKKKPCDMTHLLKSFINETGYSRNFGFCDHLLDQKMLVKNTGNGTQHAQHHMFSYETGCNKQIFEIGIDPRTGKDFLNIYDFNKNELFHYEQNNATGSCSDLSKPIGHEGLALLKEYQLAW